MGIEKNQGHIGDRKESTCEINQGLVITFLQEVRWANL